MNREQSSPPASCDLLVLSRSSTYSLTPPLRVANHQVRGHQLGVSGAESCAHHAARVRPRTARARAPARLCYARARGARDARGGARGRGFGAGYWGGTAWAGRRPPLRRRHRRAPRRCGRRRRRRRHHHHHHRGRRRVGLTSGSRRLGRRMHLRRKGGARSSAPARRYSQSSLCKTTCARRKLAPSCLQHRQSPSPNGFWRPG